MINILALIAILFATGNTYANQVETIKTFDGAVARCQRKSDLYRFRLGVHTLKAKSIKIEDDKLLIDTDVAFYRCAHKGNRVGFERVSAFENLSFPHITLDGEKTLINIKTNEMKIRLIGANQNLLSDSFISLDTHRQTVRLEANISDALSEDDLIKLNNGVEIKLDFLTFILKDLTFESSKGISDRDQINFGEFRLRAILRLDGDNLEAKII